MFARILIERERVSESGGGSERSMLNMRNKGNFKERQRERGGGGWDLCEREL